MSSLLIEISMPPYSNHTFKEVLDIALVSAAFEHEVALLFSGLGVYALAKQKPANLAHKDWTAILPGLALYDIDNIYVEAESLKAASMQPADCIDNVSVIERKQITMLSSRYQQLLRF